MLALNTDTFSKIDHNSQQSVLSKTIYSQTKQKFSTITQTKPKPIEEKSRTVTE
jgi:hypothetical protein